MSAEGMPPENASPVERPLLGLTRLVLRFPVTTLIVGALLAAGAMGLSQFRLGFRTNRLDLINPKSEFNRLWLDYIGEFGDQEDVVLVVEGAGGLLVPLTRKTLFIDVFARWGAPVILCARAGLGTLNHTLLSLEALRARRMPILGVALLGDAHADNARVIAEMGQVPVLGRLPRLDPLTPESLATAFASAFRRADFDPERACP